MKWQRVNFLALVPLLAGSLFPLLVKWNHHRFRMGDSGPREAIASEFLLLLVLLSVWLTSAGFVFFCLKERNWLAALLTVVASILSVGLFIWGLSLGAAMLYAT